MMLNCPRCGKEADIRDNPFRPFCSERCKLVDLGNWITGTYCIKDRNAPEDEDGGSSSQEDSDKK
jgi:endogenous inhibitor of DNA gyrase (YacG/DUF329 family)